MCFVLLLKLLIVAILFILNISCIFLQIKKSFHNLIQYLWSFCSLFIFHQFNLSQTDASVSFWSFGLSLNLSWHSCSDSVTFTVIYTVGSFTDFVSNVAGHRRLIQTAVIPSHSALTFAYIHWLQSSCSFLNLIKIKLCIQAQRQH